MRGPIRVRPRGESMIRTVSQFRDELADREAIRDCLYRYSRGVDRCDEEVLRSAYWEDAFDDHVLFSGTREPFIAWVLPALRAMEQSMHMIGNILIRLHGESCGRGVLLLRLPPSPQRHGLVRLNRVREVSRSLRAPQ